MSDSIDILAGHRRMRACLLGIRPLDPAGVDQRLSEFDGEIARLERLLGVESASAVPVAPVARMEFVVIGGGADQAAPSLLTAA